MISHHSRLQWLLQNAPRTEQERFGPIIGGKTSYRTGSADWQERYNRYARNTRPQNSQILFPIHLTAAIIRRHLHSDSDGESWGLPEWLSQVVRLQLLVLTSGSSPVITPQSSLFLFRFDPIASVVPGPQGDGLGLILQVTYRSRRRKLLIESTLKERHRRLPLLYRLKINFSTWSN